MEPIRKSHRPHQGELAVQRKRGVPTAHGLSVVDFIRGDMARPHKEFYRKLPYLPLGVLDARGMPWATILCNPETVATTSTVLQVGARVPPGDPFVQAVCAPNPDGRPRHFAGVAIDFTTRMRVKLGGLVDTATLDATARLNLVLRTNEHMGNCPKYITVRHLRRKDRTPETVVQTGGLSTEAIQVVQQASTAFVATRHGDRDPRASDMGLNHRGGPHGFIRVLEDSQGTHLVLPDYSGNRFYQSLGNVETDPVMGVAVPDFNTGALVQVSGRARNLFDEDAARVMPGASLVTVVSVDQAVFTRGALDLELVGEEEPSPYNPLRWSLATELPPDRKAVDQKAQLVAITQDTHHVKTFTVALSTPVEVVPGGHAIFDFSSRVKRGYQHMNDAAPRSLNDDAVRTFTVSRISPDRRQVSITVKKRGVISSYLHTLSLPRDAGIEFDLKGFGGTFTCFQGGGVVPEMIWVAGGVGITPFLAMYRALRDAGQPMPSIALDYACRGDELALIQEMTDIPVRVFDSTSTVTPVDTALRTFHGRRLQAADLAAHPGLDRQTVFVCGPQGFMSDVKSWLGDTVPPERLRFERFDF